MFGKKTEDVPHHKGQFSFPGGVVRSSDASVVDAALREAQEEIGLGPQAVEVLGLFHDIPTTVTNFVITPVLGLARNEPSFRPDGREIERVIEIPLLHLLEPNAFREEEWERGGVKRPVLFVNYGDDVVWGTTGRRVAGVDTGPRAPPLRARVHPVGRLPGHPGIRRAVDCFAEGA